MGLVVVVPHGSGVGWIEKEIGVKRSDVAVAEELVVFGSVAVGIERRTGPGDAAFEKVVSARAAREGVGFWVEVSGFANGKHLAGNFHAVFADGLLTPNFGAES